jgi:hypothetical protein
MARKRHPRCKKACKMLKNGVIVIANKLQNIMGKKANEKNYLTISLQFHQYVYYN